MASVLDSRVAEIPELCRRHGVARLELFGSAAGDAFGDLVTAGSLQNPCFIEAVNKTRRLALHHPGTAGRITKHRRIVDFRNVLAHGYDLIDHRIVWITRQVAWNGDMRCGRSSNGCIRRPSGRR